MELQRDRNFRKEITRDGVDGSKYSLGQIRAMKRVKEIANDYKDYAIAGAVIGSFVPGVGTGLGAAAGFLTGVGVRAYGAHADYLDVAFERFKGDVEEFLNK